MKQRNQKHIALLSVVLVPALLLSACGSGASGQLSSSSTCLLYTSDAADE